MCVTASNMENTSFFGLSLILFVIQLTGPSYVRGYSFNIQNRHDKLSNENLPELKPEIGSQKHIYDVNGEQKDDGNGTDLERNWGSFIENLDLFNRFADFIKSVTLSIINGNYKLESRNYLRILNAVVDLTDIVKCNNSTAYYDFIYYGTVNLSLIKEKISPKNVAIKVSERVDVAASKIKKAKYVIESMKTTDCVKLTTKECDEHINQAMRRSDIFRIEAGILFKLANLDQLYIPYHEEFRNVSYRNMVFSYLMKSKDELRPLIQNIVKTKLETGIIPPC